jgi:hypothetical protein
MGLSSAGISPEVARGLAEATTGTTKAAEAAKSAARDLASTLPQSTGNLQTATANMLEAVKVLEKEAEVKVQEAVDEVEANKPPSPPPPAGSSAPPTEKFDPATGKPIVNPFTDPVGAAMEKQGLDATVSSPAAGATPSPDQQVEVDVQKVFVVNLNEMSSLASSGPSDLTRLREQVASLTTSPEQVDSINSMGLDELKQVITQAGAIPDTGGVSVAATDQGMLDSLISGITAPLTAVSDLGSSVKDAVTAPFTALTGAIGPLTGAIGPLNTSIQTLASALGGGLDLSGLTGFGENLAGFNESFKAQVDRLEAMNINITFGAPVDVNVNINGGEALKSITAQAKQEIMAEVSKKLKNLYVGNTQVENRSSRLGGKS